jgi:poly(A) polymerase
MILDRESYDIDFATSLLPNEIEKILKKSKEVESVYDVGKKFGTIGCIINGMQLEFTTYRKDCYDGDSRKPIVEFTEKLKEDLIRRDFTVNALALDLHTMEVVDYFNGLQDIKNKILRTPLEPESTFNDDPLRMMRAIRFVSSLNFGIEKNVMQAIQKMSKEIKRVSIERIVVEMDKMLAGKYVSRAIKLFVASELSKEILPELNDILNIEQPKEYHIKDVFEHTISVVENVPQDMVNLRWAALLHDIGKAKTMEVIDDSIHFYGHEHVGASIAENILKRMKCSNEKINYITAMVELHMRLIHIKTLKATRRLSNDVAEKNIPFEDLIVLGKADITSSNPKKIQKGLRLADNILNMYNELKEREEDKVILPLDGNEIMETLNIKPGEVIGYIKNQLEEAVLEEEIKSDDKKTARLLIRKFYKDVTKRKP